MVKLRRPQGDEFFKLGFEIGGGGVAEGGMPAFVDVMADLKLASVRTGEAAAVKQFSCEATLKQFGGGVVTAVAAPAHALQCTTLRNQGLESDGRVLAAPGDAPASLRSEYTSGLPGGRRMARGPAHGLRRKGSTNRTKLKG
ncbi:hypothetical protein GCM10011378_42070 [Hymenobacter glacieicola]|uniref:Uncharacterized protein n=1 Tax=Hymenobacter glacieicola TaxID=1562124 RepID=A0ABQ1X605_9BACT|nr:hypothetical protein GCM10011378_42070 [Hymenobacter glacieicola]